MVTRCYQRYEIDDAFGVISSSDPKVLFLCPSNLPHICVCGTAESVTIWNLKTGDCIHKIKEPNQLSAVSCLGLSADSLVMRLGVGYADGWVRLFQVQNEPFSVDVDAHFRAGQSKVSCMDVQNDTLVCSSGSEISVLDVVSGSGSRLKGHRGFITRLRLIQNASFLISSSQDTFIKFWDLTRLHCFATLTGHSGPVWDFALTSDNRTLVSGSADSKLRLWKLTHFSRDEPASLPQPDKSESNETILVPLTERQCYIQAEFVGCFSRTGSRRVHSLIFDPSGEFLLVQSLERNLEIFRVLTEDARAKRLRKKIKKSKEKNEQISGIHLQADDLIRPVIRLTLPAKVASCDVLPARPVWNDGKTEEIRLRFMCSLKNNTIELLEARLPFTGITKPRTLQATNRISDQHNVTVRLVNRISSHGHRSPPLSCLLTADGLGIFTLAKSEAKLWSRHSTACLVTLQWRKSELDSTALMSESVETSPIASSWPTHASSFVLAPGDRHVVIGFESGHLLLFDVQAKSATQLISNAHRGAVRCLGSTGDRKGIVTGGSDKLVGFYNFDLKTTESGVPALCLVTARHSESVADQITCLGVSPNNRFVVIGMVNFHVDVYFFDSFKRVHSLYGHAAPVSSLDISSDSRLIITGGADKTVRLWELQFGNCQRRFTTHMDPVSCVRFIPHTALAVSCDLGGLIKQWDVAKLREVATLKGHHGGVTCLATAATNAAVFNRKIKDIQKKKFHKKAQRSNDEDSEEDELDDLCGGLVISCGRDFSIRVWSETEDLLILEEEEMRAREAAEEAEELVRSEAIIPGAMPPELSETGLLGRPTPNTRDAADMLMEAIDIYEQETNRLQMAATGKTVPPAHPLLAVRGTDCPEKFLLLSLATLRAPSSRMGGGGAGLEHALGLITTDYVRRLLPCLAKWLSRGWEVELVGRAIRHLVTLHFGLVFTSLPLRDMLQQSRDARQEEVGRLKGLVGMNLAGLDYLRRKIEEKEQLSLFDDILHTRDKRLKRQKAKRNRMALLLPG